MEKTYELIHDLCKERKTSIPKMCKETGLSRSLFAELKAGRTKRLSTKTLETVASFLEVPITYLLDLGEPNPADIPPESELSDDQLIFAFWKNNPKKMDKSDLERLRSFAKYLEQEKEG